MRHLFRVLPTFLILALLAGIGWYGHRTGWALPKFAELTGRARPADDWCGEHTVPESECVECNAALLPRPTAFGWCKVHGVHECTLEHPELAQLPALAIVTQEDLERARLSLAFAPRTQNNAICKLHLRRIQFASTDAYAKTGVDVEPAWRSPVVEFVAAPGEVVYDQTKVAHLATRSVGSVWRVYKRLGDKVRQGEIVALVDAVEVGKAKAEFQNAVASQRLRRKNYDILKAGAAAVPRTELFASESAYQEANIRVQAARQSIINLGFHFDLADFEKTPDADIEKGLRFLGLPTALTHSFDEMKTPSNLLPLIAPMDGVVVSSDVVAGEVVNTEKTLFEIVDTRSLWLTLEVRAEDARKIALGQTVRFRADGDAAEIAAPVTWIGTQADPKTRMVKVRAEINDPDGKRMANVFGSGRIILREEPKAVVVPNEAVHWEGDCHVVFVRDRDWLKEGAPKVFHTRTVRIGARDARQTEIIAGVLPGELVAVKNSGALRAELLRGTLGEG